MPKPTKTPPRALTSMPAAKLDWSREEAPVSTEFDDVYYSVDDGLEETRNVFLKACGLPERWAEKTEGRDVFTIGELGFGSGLNFLAAWQLWRERRPSEMAQLHFVSVEGFPLSKEELAQALAPWPELSEFAHGLIKKWPGRVPGQHRIELGDGVVLTLCHDEVMPALENVTMHADCWFLDGFSPAKNPDMWSEAVLKRIYDLSSPGARVGTFTVAGFVRRGLADAGFEVNKREGFGRKRERLEAVKPQAAAPRALPGGTAIIIGSGIAGASLARSFLSRGITPILIDPNDDTAASGNPAAIIKPRLDLQDRPESRLFLSSYLYAVQAYQETDQGSAILHRGVTQAAKTKKDLARYTKIAKQAALSDAHLKLISAKEIEMLTGIQTAMGGLWFGSALAIDPKQITQNWTQGADRIMARAGRIEKTNALWQVYDEQDNVLAKSSHIYVTMGAGIDTLLPHGQLDIRFLRGQLTWGQAAKKAPLMSVLSYGGYALKMEGGDILLGATHNNTVANDAVSDEDDRRNIDAYIAMGGHEIAASGARASVRVTTPHTLPICGELEPGLSVMTGLGGRGFVFAPLLAEHLVSEYTQTPHPIAKDAALRLSVRSFRD